ncbi:NAD-dependent epimerase/dehydratase family protein [Gottschalkia acidurici 9a]|uniref:NAD-dependent epimerase/dehydratase family protein n=1 Tax=Gottschalkia acidurici (strain ATCC 7906 / DSM 604 / BCRC 14475 / CIP 104303 / KCTC 5404 / NCIMB 10678 / 9a) TaxID=1128398 RepID=K0AY64_GOTA9|nr:SDR family oxidoreductase [Gottschalkia acidurici]AFS78728.1 NAD-dependent epimerase/dehydratase family protein [Gottschalkia acidurici 9a]
MKSVLVMGGTSFVSSFLAKHLIGQGYNVDILTRGLKSIDYDGFREQLICDRKSKNEVQEVLEGRKYEFVFDISAYTKADVEILLTSIDKNELKKYVFCSSGAVYEPSSDTIKESFKKGENSNWGKYGIDKKEAEDFIINSGIPYTIFRPPYIYGENNNLYREIYFFDRIINNKEIPIPFGKDTKTQFIHINDLVRIFESVMYNESSSNIYNVTNPELISWDYFIAKCGEVIGKTPIMKKIDVNQVKLESRSYFPFRDVTYVLDTEQLMKSKLYKPTISLEEGLKRAYEWYIDKKPKLNDVKMMDKVNELLGN